jgi:hypothetical protein
MSCFFFVTAEKSAQHDRASYDDDQRIRHSNWLALQSTT